MAATLSGPDEAALAALAEYDLGPVLGLEPLPAGQPAGRKVVTPARQRRLATPLELARPGGQPPGPAVGPRLAALRTVMRLLPDLTAAGG